MTNIEQYQKVQVMTSDGVRLIIMLYEGIVRFNGGAIEAINNDNIEDRAYFINRSMDIISELNGALNMEEGGEVAKNLSKLYDYCVHSLNKANAENSVEALEGVNKVITEVKAGWLGITSEKASEDDLSSDSAEPGNGYSQGAAQGGL
ncbi:Flagellar biosynthesis protein FliS [hydrothermal vent metagenome]|uniref:Flagellar biosynthesis protein FliS n=1 Tax=hydrothermal vent metagenome TaxID=652676 RepID=A0A3B0QZ25_9ZZZZ